MLDLKWPSRHSPDEFKVIMGASLVTGARAALVKLPALSEVLLGLVAYPVIRYTI
ncbi:hypothetical protein F5X96DRAFT_662582 [Biscogniauxia mediterranea]|nr:hypothetical protein F5X96DRAFT_662582 [Biscogniauxia mediterranea]